MNTYLHKLSVPLVLLLLTACGTGKFTVENINTYKIQPLQNAKIFPAKQDITGLIPKIIILNANSTNNELGLKANVSQAMANSLKTTLANVYPVIVNSPQNGTLENDIKLAKPYHGPAIADYAVLGTISEIKLATDLKSQMSDIGNGLSSRVENCTYKVSLIGKFDTYKVPSMQRHTTTEYAWSTIVEVPKGKATVINTMDSFAEALGNKLTGTGRSNEDAIAACPYSDRQLATHINRAVQEGIGNIRYTLINSFSARGYIVERRENADKVIFKTNIGSLQGARPTVKVEILSLQNVSDLTTIDSNVAKFKIGEGFITTLVEPDNSWIVVEDPKVIQRVKAGDIIRLHYERSWFSPI